MIDAVRGPGPVADRTLDWPCAGRRRWRPAYLQVSGRAGLVVLGGALRWLGPAAGERQVYRIAEMMLQARYDSYVTPDIGRIPRTALPPGTLVVIFSPLLDPRGFTALTDLRQRGFPLVVVDTLRDEPPASPRSANARSPSACGAWTARRIVAALRDLGVPVLSWDDRHRTRQRARPPAPAAARRRPGGQACPAPRRPGREPRASQTSHDRRGREPQASRTSHDRRGRGPGRADRGLAAGVGAALDLRGGQPRRGRGRRRGGPALAARILRSRWLAAVVSCAFSTAGAPSWPPKACSSSPTCSPPTRPQP